MSGGGGGTSQTIQKADPWSGQQPYLLDIFQKAQDAQGKVGTTPADIYAGPNVTQQGALAGMSGAVWPAASTLQQGTGAGLATLEGIGAGNSAFQQAPTVNWNGNGSLDFMNQWIGNTAGAAPTYNPSMLTSTISAAQGTAPTFSAVDPTAAASAALAPLQRNFMTQVLPAAAAAAGAPGVRAFGSRNGLNIQNLTNDFSQTASNALAGIGYQAGQQAQALNANALNTASQLGGSYANAGQAISSDQWKALVDAASKGFNQTSALQEDAATTQAKLQGASNIAGLNAQLQAAQAEPGAATATYNTALQPWQTMGQIGGQQQSWAQDFLNAQNQAPFNGLSQYGNLINGANLGGAGSQSTTTSSGSGVGNIFTGALGGGLLGGMIAPGGLAGLGAAGGLAAAAPYLIPGILLGGLLGGFG